MQEINLRQDMLILAKKVVSRLFLNLGRQARKKTHLVCNRQYYTYRCSVKVSSLAQLLLYGVHVINRRKVILFCDSPSTFWLIKLLISNLDTNIRIIGVKHKSRYRNG